MLGGVAPVASCGLSRVPEEYFEALNDQFSRQIAVNGDELCHADPTLDMLKTLLCKIEVAKVI